MNRRSRIIGTAVILLGFVIGTGRAMRSATPDGNAQRPAKENWPQATGDWGNNRYSALSQINTDTVKNLGAAWVSDKFDDAAASRVTPVVHDGLMFFTAGDKVYALDAKTGKSVWKYQTQGVPLAVTGMNGNTRARGTPNWQGVAVAEGKVFVALTDAQMYAIDEKTGKLVWRCNVGNVKANERGGISAVPVYVNGVLYTGLVFGEGRYIGQAIALDAKDGHELWHWSSIPGPGEPGHNTWTEDPKNNTWKMGGADVWQTPVVDLDLGLVFYGTGNPSPNRVGNVRPGDNLYSCSVVALDMKTGKMKWYFQVAHHDFWEDDIATPIIAYDSQVNGKAVKGLGVMRPDGTLFLLDRATGKPVWPVEERHVRQSALYMTAATQPFPKGRGSFIERDCSHWQAPEGFLARCEFFHAPSDDPPNVLTYAPTTRSAPMSYDPQTGYFYINGIDRMQWQWNSPQPSTWEWPTLYMTQHVPSIDKQAALIFAAVDPATYKVVWRKEFRMPSSIYGVGGWLTTGGGLAFHRIEDGNLVAYDAKTGDELWKFQTGLVATDTTSPMSYEVEGQQYVAVVEESQVWAFRLGGDVPPRPEPKLPDLHEGMQTPIQDSQIIRASVPDEYNYKHDIGPSRARVKAGSEVTFLNNGSEVHTFVALDGSWTTGPLLPRQTVILTFNTPGHFLYHCKEHPWSYGELIVTEPATAK